MTNQEVKVREKSCKRPDENGAPVERQGHKTVGPMGALDCQVAVGGDLNMSASMDVLQDARKGMLALEGIVLGVSNLFACPPPAPQREVVTLLEDVREEAWWWMIDYNEGGPHDSPEDLTPSEFRQKSQGPPVLNPLIDAEAYDMTQSELRHELT
jgi:hypothetical protein